MNSKIKVSIENVNGLAQKILELKTFLRDQNVDIMLIFKTHFNNKNYIKILNYVINDTQHPDGKAYEGTAVIIKETMKNKYYPLWTITKKIKRSQKFITPIKLSIGKRILTKFKKVITFVKYLENGFKHLDQEILIGEEADLLKQVNLENIQ